jgi:hypothetical protein
MLQAAKTLYPCAMSLCTQAPIQEIANEYDDLANMFIKMAIAENSQFVHEDPTLAMRYLYFVPRMQKCNVIFNNELLEVHMLILPFYTTIHVQLYAVLKDGITIAIDLKFRSEEKIESIATWPCKTVLSCFGPTPCAAVIQSTVTMYKSSEPILNIHEHAERCKHVSGDKIYEKQMPFYLNMSSGSELIDILEKKERNETWIRRRNLGMFLTSFHMQTMNSSRRTSSGNRILSGGIRSIYGLHFMKFL